MTWMNIGRDTLFTTVSGESEKNPKQTNQEALGLGTFPTFSSDVLSSFPISLCLAYFALLWGSCKIRNLSLEVSDWWWWQRDTSQAAQPSPFFPKEVLNLPKPSDLKHRNIRLLLPVRAALAWELSWWKLQAWTPDCKPAAFRSNMSLRYA